jgi:hypothetical protein
LCHKVCVALGGFTKDKSDILAGIVGKDKDEGHKGNHYCLFLEILVTKTGLVIDI